MQSILDIIKTIETENPCVNPTVIYNEGWMARLLVHQSIVEGLSLGNLDLSSISNWTSEALISSPFINAKKYREGYTHADIAIGDFDVDFSKRGEIDIQPEATLFGIIEAKMGSNLSQGTTHVKDYNQASRNLVCIASNTIDKPKCNIFFYVVAPQMKLIEQNIKAQIDLQFVKNQIENRFSLHTSESLILKEKSAILAKINNCDIQAISYETWISCIKDITAQKSLQEFYNKAKKWNRI